jgi:23S rRNA (cytosine1962-C5)-methyltransferase
LEDYFLKLPGKKLKVLNLFAFTGLASIFCAQRNALVCHVDISKQALDWASKNLELNAIPREQVRLIADDAIKFLEREVKRGNKYDVVIADPPTFSRVAKGKSWDLDQIVAPLLRDCLAVLDSTQGALLFSSHHHALPPEVVNNVIADYRPDTSGGVEGAYFSLIETETGRQIPAGSLTAYTTGEFRAEES